RSWSDTVGRMTVEDQDPTARGARTDAQPRAAAAAPGSGARPSGDLERYSGLFAQRTQVMKSSAMRDLMALTERPDVISLAGGLADTTLFPAEDLAKVLSHMAAGDAARALQYGPTEGMAEIQPCLAEVMAAEGAEVDPDD